MVSSAVDSEEARSCHGLLVDALDHCFVAPLARSEKRWSNNREVPNAAFDFAEASQRFRSRAQAGS